jgi:hypothetical protein
LNGNFGFLLEWNCGCSELVSLYLACNVFDKDSEKVDLSFSFLFLVFKCLMEYNVFYMLGVRIRIEIYCADRRVHVDPCCFGI